MNKTIAFFGLALGVSICGSAFADDPAVTCEEGVFAEKVESRKPSGDASSIAAAHKATYFVVIKNPGAATSVTLVWKLDGSEVQRQSLDVGTSPGWKTWGTRWIGDAKRVEVTVLDASGATLKEDALSL